LIDTRPLVGARLGEGIVCPSATKSNVENNTLVLDHVTHLARIRTRHQGIWWTPIGRYWILGSDIRRNVSPAESPYFGTGG